MAIRGEAAGGKPLAISDWGGCGAGVCLRTCGGVAPVATFSQVLAAEKVERFGGDVAYRASAWAVPPVSGRHP